MSNYSFSLIWSDRDGGYIATSPEFPGLSGFGESPGVALTEAETALDLAREAAARTGEGLPAARVRERYSGQFRVRLPRDLHRQLAEQAEAEGVSLNTLVISRLAASAGRAAAEPAAAEMRETGRQVVQACRTLLSALDEGAAKRASRALYVAESGPGDADQPAQAGKWRWNTQTAEDSAHARAERAAGDAVEPGRAGAARKGNGGRKEPRPGRGVAQ